ncbi:MAG: FAD-dependent oxidoreductase [Deltaproteobacteria bacterium]|nr:FAD-dependent oxidoreductase [Deltaproteobacteria bacterium]
MTQKYDVIIVGAGPAGLAAARMTGSRGLKVLLVDMKKDITKIFRSCCCNLIIEPGTHRETVSYADGRIHFKQARFSVPYSGAVMPLKNSFKLAPGGTPLKINGKSPDGCVALSYEKEAFIQDMYADVQQMKTVEIMPATQAVKAENVDGGVRVTLRTGQQEFSLTGKVAVAADGVNSKLVQSLGLNETRRKFFARFAVVSFHMADVDCPYPDSWLTFVGKGHTRARRGQLYMCPKPHAGQTDPPIYELTLGMPLVPDAHCVAEEELRHFVTHGPFAAWFRRMKVVDVRAATLNFYTPLIDPVEGRVVVVGDAAAFIETYVQGAVMYGYQAGNAIAEFLSSGTGLDDYRAAWGASFEYNDPEEIKKATQGFGLHVLNDDDLDYLFGLTKTDDIRGYVNEFSDPVTVRSALLQHIEQVKRERPALGETLAQFSRVSVSEALQAGKQ